MESFPSELDIGIIGCGPVGLVLALCLQNSPKTSHLKIAIIEKQGALYPLPRAGEFEFNSQIDTSRFRSYFSFQATSKLI